jgi:hypothetical protein
MTATLNRREWLALSTLSGVGLLLPAGCGAPPLTSQSPHTRLALPPAAASNATLPPGKRVVGNWTTALVPAADAGEPLRLALDDAGRRQRIAPGTAGRLRITCAWDVRGEITVEATLTESRKPIGRFDLRWPYPLQPFELELTADDTAAVARQGVSLQVTGTPLPIRIFTSGGSATAPPAYLPHLVVGDGGDRSAAMLDRLAALDSLQPFGWYEGCVLDAQWDLQQATGLPRYRQAMDRHLAMFLDPAGSLIHEKTLNVPADGVFPGIEYTLPVAAIVRTRPDHPLVDVAVKFWKSRLDPQEAVIDGTATTTEGAYTVAYPMALVARARNDTALMNLAIRQLAVRANRNVIRGDIYQRVGGPDGKPAVTEGRNWSRGVAWMLLGMVRTLQEAPPAIRPPAVLAELTTLARRCAATQHSSGLWHCFLGEADTGLETSGSAGIAAALAIGVRAGLLTPDLLGPARNAQRGLRNWVTPDGYLAGVAQRNAGGPPLQRGGYRVIAPFAMGLLGQLHAALLPGVGR